MLSCILNLLGADNTVYGALFMLSVALCVAFIFGTVHYELWQAGPKL